MRNSVFQLVYTSLSTGRMSEAELHALLEQSLRNNSKYDITGMLLYMESNFIGKMQGRFLQLLEGDKEAVEMIYQRITLDARNSAMLKMHEGAGLQRSFPDWTMGFKVIDPVAHNTIDGFFNLDETFLKRGFSDHSSRALSYLNSFYVTNIG